MGRRIQDCSDYTPPALRRGVWRFRSAALLFACTALRAGPLAAQLPLIVHGAAGIAFDVGDVVPVTGAGVVVLGGVGLLIHHVAFGGEVGRYALGGDRRARLVGAFLRLPALAGRQVAPYFVLGLGCYRYSPAAGSHDQAFGGSVGPGLAVAISRRRARLLFEARFHGALDRSGTIGGQDFVSVAAGVELGL
jgi:hypothetical protein